MINILTSLCTNCGAENVDWKEHYDTAELVACYTCHSLYELDCNLISINTVEAYKVD